MNSLNRSFADDFSCLVKQQPECPAIIDSNSLEPFVITYEDLQALLDKYITFFQMNGVQREDVILSIMPNSTEALICFLATIKGGYGFAPLPCTASGREVSRWVELVKPKLCLLSTNAPEEHEKAVGASGVNRVVVQPNSSFDWLPEFSADIKDGAEARLYLSTSGSTGEPKAIIIDSNKLWSSGWAFTRYMNMASDGSSRFWNYLPMSYLGGLFNLGLIPLAVGGSVVIDEPFNGKTFLNYWQFVDRFNINVLWLIPTIVGGLLELAERRQADELARYGEIIRHAFLGTAPIELRTKQRFEMLFRIPLVENFALSETTFFTTERVDDLSKRVEGSVGKPLPYVTIAFGPGAKKQNGERYNEVLVKTPFAFIGYLKPDGSVQFGEDADGYIHTGDIGYFNEDGLLIIKGRTRDIIKKGGNFISLREVEVLATQHEAVRNAAAVSIPHRFYGEDFALYLEMAGPCDASAQKKFRAWLHDNIVKYKWPSSITFMEKFPRTSSGKICKHLLGTNE